MEIVLDGKIDWDIESMSEEFQVFYQHFFTEASIFWRKEISLSFLDELVNNDLELAKELINRNIKRRVQNIIDGAGYLKDKMFLPNLKDLLSKQEDIEWKLIVSRAINQIDSSSIYSDY